MTWPPFAFVNANALGLGIHIICLLQPTYLWSIVLLEIRSSIHSGADHIGNRWSKLIRLIIVLSMWVFPASLTTIAQDRPSADLQPCGERPGTITLPRINYNYYCLETITQADAGRPFAYTALAFAEDGSLYATRPLQGQLIHLTDAQGDGLPESEQVILSDLDMPNVLFMAEDSLYIAGGAHIYRYADGELTTLVDDLPSGTGYWTGGLVVHDERLYVGIGVNCDDCSPDPDRGVILSYALDGRDRQVVATGLHQPAALTVFRGDVWFTDIMPADDAQYPHDEVNRLIVGADYGYPTCANECELPIIPIARGYAPVALLAYKGEAFPNLEGQLLALLAGAERTAQLRGPDLVGFDLEPERIIAEALFPYDPTVYEDMPFAINIDTGYINPATNYLNQRGAGFWPQRLYGLAINTQGWMVFSVSDGRLMALRPR